MRFLLKLSQQTLYRVILCLVVSIFFLFNICVTQIGEKINWKLDMTEEKLYELSQLTIDAGKGLTDPTDIFILASEKDYPSVFKEVLSRYAGLSGNLKVSYKDPFENPLFVDHYRELGYNLSENDLVISGKNGVRQLAYDDMFIFSGEEVTGIKLEQSVTGSLLYVNSDEKPKAAFTTAHNEKSSAALQGIFQDNSFEIVNLSPARRDPDDADIVVIASPAKDFSAKEIVALEKYLAAGGKIMAFMEPSSEPCENLKAFLAKYGLELQNNVIFEEKAFVSDNPLNVIPMYGVHPINTYFVENPYYVVMPSSRGITLNEQGDLKTTALLMTTKDSYGKEELSYESQARKTEDTSGPFVLAAIGERSVWNSGKEEKSAVFLAGARNLYADDIMNAGTYANRQFLTQVINYLTESAQSVNIPAKTLSMPPLLVTRQKSLIIAVVLVVILPALILAMGVCIYRKRKSL